MRLKGRSDAAAHEVVDVALEGSKIADSSVPERRIPLDEPRGVAQARPLEPAGEALERLGPVAREPFRSSDDASAAKQGSGRSTSGSPRPREVAPARLRSQRTPTHMTRERSEEGEELRGRHVRDGERDRLLDSNDGIRDEGTEPGDVARVLRELEHRRRVVRSPRAVDPGLDPGVRVLLPHDVLARDRAPLGDAVAGDEPRGDAARAREHRHGRRKVGAVAELLLEEEVEERIVHLAEERERVMVVVVEALHERVELVLVGGNARGPFARELLESLLLRPWDAEVGRARAGGGELVPHAEHERIIRRALRADGERGAELVRHERAGDDVHVTPVEREEVAARGPRDAPDADRGAGGREVARDGDVAEALGEGGLGPEAVGAVLVVDGAAEVVDRERPGGRDHAEDLDVALDHVAHFAEGRPRAEADHVVHDELLLDRALRGVVERRRDANETERDRTRERDGHGERRAVARREVASARARAGSRARRATRASTTYAAAKAL